MNTAAHDEFLRRACADAGVEALGYLPGSPAFAIPSRYLSLSINADIQHGVIAEALTNTLPATVDLDRLLAVTRTAAPVPRAPTPSAIRGPTRRAASPWPARRPSFFTYRQNLAVLERFGKITCLRSLTDTTLPAGTGFLYLPGGYPELFAGALSTNLITHASIVSYCASGDLAYTECSGTTYLGNSITNTVDWAFMMVGGRPCTTSLANARVTLGYRAVECNNLIIGGYGSIIPFRTTTT